ncbi:unnamed protein product [Adineta ricciae]|uniref:LON peptidase N-terminal domain and RING finger protein 3 n=1 Tax=Adineta ricciae TaxID=249248 RepID=A0A815FNH0_ADIRI|nr:unnamed protein product [Adineta ricciae]CAF1325776.1 unnamed protein product [Adineta ricciae]
MYSNYHPNSSKSSLVRVKKRKLRLEEKKKSLLKVKSSLLIQCCQQFLADLRKPGARFLSYTSVELEPICHQLAIQQMATSSSLAISCPWICSFCEDLIYEPLTLYCGHTYCEQCIKDSEDTSIDCPRCPRNIQGQITSSIRYAIDHGFSRNHFLKEIIERMKTLEFKCENIRLYQQARNECTHGNYQQAIEIYSQIITKYDNEYLAFYGRAKTYVKLKQFDNALTDTDHVIRLKPFWRKGYYCRSQILFETKRFTSALLSSLHGLTIDPDDQTGKQLMAQHLHAVLHDNDQPEGTFPTETRSSPLIPNDTSTIVTNSGTCGTKLLTCRSTSTSSCFCSLADHKQLSVKDFECSICVNLLWLPMTTPCGHVFCRECLIRSIDNTQAQCPMCKNPLDEFFPLLIQSYVNTTEIISQIIESFFPEEYRERQALHEQENIDGVLIPKLLSNNTDASTIFEIPIFVCVLPLPFCSCPLHVFEPRYRLLIRRTMATQSRTFGMCTYDEETEMFTDYGTLLYIRGLVYTRDGRSIVDTIGRRRFRVVDRGMRDQYYTARVQLIRDHPIEQEDFDGLSELNRNIYSDVRHWFDQLDTHRQDLISRQLEEYPSCDDFTRDSTDGPSWAWKILDVLPIESQLQYTAFISQSLRTRLQIIKDTIDFLQNQIQPATVSSNNDS